MPTPLKFLLVSTHIHQYTGYSKVSYEIVQALSKIPWIKLVHFGFQGMSGSGEFRKYPDNVAAWDAGKYETPRAQGFGFSEFRDFVRCTSPDVIMIQNDAAVVAQFLQQLNGLEKTWRIWIQFDQVYQQTKREQIDILNQTDRVFAFSKYWEENLRREGCTVARGNIMHGFADDLFSVGSAEESRRLMGLPQGVPLILNLNRNTPRKRQDFTVAAFVELLRRRADTGVHLVCSTNADEAQGGFKLKDILVRECRLRGVPEGLGVERLLIVNAHMRLSDGQINHLQNACDIGLNTCCGEGWGLCNFEHAGVGKPQVVNWIGGFKEFFDDTCAGCVRPAVGMQMTGGEGGLGGQGEFATPESIASALERYVVDADLRRVHGERAMARVRGYTWERCLAPLVEGLAEEAKGRDERLLAAVRAAGGGERAMESFSNGQIIRL